MACSRCFSDLPGPALVDTLSFISHAAKRIESYGMVCRAWHATLTEDLSWKHLCKSHWYATECRIKEWPTLTPKGLYQALELWAPLEGYYVFTPAFPWGLLVLIRITSGRVVADVLRFLPNRAGKFVEMNVPLFRVDLSEEDGSRVRSSIEACWANAGEDRALTISACDTSSTRARTEARGFFTEQAMKTLLPNRRILRLQREGAHELDEPDEAQLVAKAEDPWDPDDFPWSDVSAAMMRTEEMLHSMCGVDRAPCDLMLISSPADWVPQDASQPQMRRGLYVGDYGHRYYGQYRTEVLLLEYVEMTIQEIRQELVCPRKVFQRGSDEQYPAPRELQALCELDCDACFTFMKVVKQCGDIHVPMGATTFVALCGPQLACDALTGQKSPPTHLENRQTRQWEPVLRAWRGFGTLARPGFFGPNWEKGWLAQLPSDPETGDDRFGFMWEGMQDAVVLCWVAAQDSCPFLQRSWLPEDLQ
mmetsp:Transcript_58789/g.140131  ORF Transcript_58789/g.140131 Transcript_58789/m.140131 type:complete len:477 (+) Transcript_58789:129-1559(+)